jgi:WD40 repeat protein
MTPPHSHSSEVSREPACIYQGDADSVFAVAWSPDSRRIASASWDLTVQVWHATRSENLLTYSGHLADHRPPWPVTVLAWSPDGRRLASVSERAVYVWDASEYMYRVSAKR